MARPEQRSALDELERAALDDSVPLATALRTAVSFGGRVGSADLREWATRELRGYDGIDEVPPYRRILAPILVDAVNGNTHVTGQRIRPGALPDFVREHVSEELALRNGIGEVEAMIVGAEAARRRSVDLSLPSGAEIAAVMTRDAGNPFQQILAVCWSVSPSTLRGVVDQLRTTLVELVAEIRAGTGADSAELPNAELATQAVNVAVNGAKSRVVVSTAQAANSGSSVVTPGASAHPSRWRRWARVGAFVVGIATIIGTIAAIVQVLH